MTEAPHDQAGKLLKENKPAEARAIWEDILKTDPKDWKALHAIGVCLVSEGQPELGLERFRQADDIEPDNPDILRNLGGCLLMLKRADEARPYFERTLAIREADEHAHFNLAMALADAGRPTETIPHYRRVMEINPKNLIAHSNLIYMLDLGDDEAAAVAERNRWQMLHGEPLKQAQTPHLNDRNMKRRIRVGYCSGDYAFHSAAFCYGPVLLNHDRDAFEVFCYSSTIKKDGYTDRFRDDFRWREVHTLTPPQMVKMVRMDKIDILVDLSGHSRENKLIVFACKPAPVQVTAWGYAVGTGLQAMDYFFADPIFVPPSHAARFTEKVIYLPVLTPFEPQFPTPNIRPLPAKENGYVTFGAFDRLERVTDQTLDLYADVLKAVPTSRILFKSAHGDDPRYQARLSNGLSSRGIDLSRVEYRGKTVHYENMKALADTDIILDSYPHGGGVTLLEGLWMGVPAVTLCTGVTASRKGNSFLTTVNLPQFIASTPVEYVKIAEEYANRLDDLAEIRGNLRRRMAASPLCDHVSYTRTVEAQYRWMLAKWAERNPNA